MPRNPYSILGVSRNADDEEIRKAYHKLAKESHPDADGGNDDYFCRLNDAYETLRTADRRRDYERRQRPASAAPRPAGSSGVAGDIFDAFDELVARFMGGEPRGGDGSPGRMSGRWPPGGPGGGRSPGTASVGGGRRYEAAVRLSPGQARQGVAFGLELPDGPRHIEIPPGVTDGDVLSYQETDDAGALVTLELAVYVD